MSALPKPNHDAIALPAASGGPGSRLRRAVSVAHREWKGAPYTVRISIFCLLLFYLFAAASPVIAPYDPAQQYRNLPDCPPMRLHIAAPSEWSNGLLFAYPMTITDAM